MTDWDPVCPDCGRALAETGRVRCECGAQWAVAAGTVYRIASLDDADEGERERIEANAREVR